MKVYINERSLKLMQHFWLLEREKITFTKTDSSGVRRYDYALEDVVIKQKM